MGILNHWHPVILSKDLKKRPLAITLDNKNLVIFRTQDGRIGALENRCCHRAMRLSNGWVEGNNLICPYHGWSYSPTGEVLSPANPHLNHCTAYLEVAESYGLIWLKSADSQAELPKLKTEGYEHIGTFFYMVQSPLEITLDNFTEVEHTATAHHFFGYSREKTPEIKTTSEVVGDTVVVTNQGVQRDFPSIVKPFIEIRPGDYFFNNWTSYFSPVYTVYDHFWFSKDLQKEKRQRLKIAIFFNPITPEKTQLITLVWARSFMGKLGFNLLVKPIMRALVYYEIDLDRQIVENIVEQDNLKLTGLKLGRFDKPLLENRKLIERVYRQYL